MKVNFEIDDNAFAALKTLQLMYDLTGYSMSSHDVSCFMLNHAENQDYEIAFSEEEEKYGFLFIDDDDMESLIIPLY